MGPSWFFFISNAHQLGTVISTFDPEAGTFPAGFMHDTSLAEVPRNTQLSADLKSPDPLDWLSQEDWHRIRFDTSKVYLLHDKDAEAKTIAFPDESYNIVNCN